MTTYNNGPWLDMTLDNLPKGAPVIVLDTREFGGNLNRTWNAGIRRLLEIGADVAIVLNDDVVLREDAGRLLTGGLLDQSGVTWTDRELLLLSARHAATNDNRTNAADWGLLNAAEPGFQPGPDFSAFCVSQKTLDIVGPFDEDFQVWCSDNDYHRRIQLAGFEAGAYAPMWHLLNGTTRANPERQAATHTIFPADKATYERKWGGWLGAERFDVPYGLQAVR